MKIFFALWPNANIEYPSPEAAKLPQAYLAKAMPLVNLLKARPAPAEGLVAFASHQQYTNRVEVGEDAEHIVLAPRKIPSVLVLRYE